MIDECGDALYGVMAYAKRWHIDTRGAVWTWASRWKAHLMAESTDIRQVRQAWHAFTGSFRAYKLSIQDELRAAAFMKEGAHTQVIYNRTIKSMRRSEIQKAFARTRRMLHESRQLAHAQRKLLRLEPKARKLRQLDANK